MYPALYILMRQDMESLNAGKAMAQAAHAATAFAWHMAAIAIREDFDTYSDDVWLGLAQWENTTKQGFGTTVVLGVRSFESLHHIIEDASEDGFPARVIHDPTYPILDGAALHAAPVDTCGFVFTPCRDEREVDALMDLPRHP